MAGQMRSGKNLAGEYICEKLGFGGASFARPVKEIFCSTFGVDMDFVEFWKVRDENPPGFNKTVRQALQFIGDGFRQINPNVWVDYAFANNPKKSCFTDGRYLNELSRVKSEGGINILVWRPGYENHDPNESESQIKRIVDWFVSEDISEGRVPRTCTEGPKGCEYIDFFVVNDGTSSDLLKKIDGFFL
jgi:hypothetical protein